MGFWILVIGLTRWPLWVGVDAIVRVGHEDGNRYWNVSAEAKVVVTA
jgi:hypothetical protein